VQVYDAAVPSAPYLGRCTAPLMVDGTRRRVVNNESADICRMLNDVELQPPPQLKARVGGTVAVAPAAAPAAVVAEEGGAAAAAAVAATAPAAVAAAAAVADAAVELRPAALAAEIDAWSARLYAGLNNGVYRCGFATSQGAYDRAARDVAAALDEVIRVSGFRIYGVRFGKLFVTQVIGLKVQGVGFGVYALVV